MTWGFKNRLNTILPDGRAVMLAIDHGYFLGPIHGLEQPLETVKNLLPYTDSLFLTRGVLSSCIPENCNTPMVMRVSGGATVVGKDLANETIVTPVKEAVKQNAIGVGVSVFVGSDYETQTVSNLANVVSEAHDYGLPVLGITAVAKELQKREARFLALASRVCVEMGADIIKTYLLRRIRKNHKHMPCSSRNRGRTETRFNRRRIKHYVQCAARRRNRSRYGPKHMAVRTSSCDDSSDTWHCEK